MILLPQECVKYTARNLQYRHKAHSVCRVDRVYWRTSVTVQTEFFFFHASPATLAGERKQRISATTSIRKHLRRQSSETGSPIRADYP